MHKLLKNKRILITAGPTREYLDPVRYISNDSSGKMGYALAQAAEKMGAKVTLISGPTNLKEPSNVKFIPLVTAKEMSKAALAEFKKADIAICAAAVADFRPTSVSNRKIKKDSARVIKLIENPDILGSMGKRKKRGQVLVGFALETDNLIKNAQKKLIKKNCDLIIANRPNNIGGNSADAIMITKNGKTNHFINKTKIQLANSILKTLTKGG